jgi:two-component system, NtrC family, response regulator AtoC
MGEIMECNEMFIYTSEKMHRIKEIIDQVADTDVTVLIQGESGVGKEVVARYTHLNSLRQDKPFMKVNCAALPQELLESELFGYEKGAFTGAYCQKPGKFELAHGGTIFLDEIAEIPFSLQAKLLQVLQDREFSRLGGKVDVRLDVRVLAATNKNIEEAVKKGQFREDLYYRLNVVNITIPPLRERKEEIPIFVAYFIDKYGKKYNKEINSLSERTMRTLLAHHWLGNVRELENMIQRYAIFGNEKAIMDGLSNVIQEDLPQEREGQSFSKEDCLSLKQAVSDAVIEAESKAIRDALEFTRWNRKKAAMMLNISYKALLYKMKRDIDKREVNI